MCWWCVQSEVMPRATRALSRVLRLADRPDAPRLALPRSCRDSQCSNFQICNGALPQTPPENLFMCAPCPCHHAVIML